MTDLAGWNVPVCMYEHASSQRRQPVHRSGTIFNTLMRGPRGLGVVEARPGPPGATRMIAVGLYVTQRSAWFNRAAALPEPGPAPPDGVSAPMAPGLPAPGQGRGGAGHRSRSSLLAVTTPGATR